MLEAYPTLHLEDMVILDGMGNDTQVSLAAPSDGMVGPRQDKIPRLERTRKAPVWTKDYVLGNTKKGSKKSLNF